MNETISFSVYSPRVKIELKGESKEIRSKNKKINAVMKILKEKKIIFHIQCSYEDLKVSNSLHFLFPDRIYSKTK